MVAILMVVCPVADGREYHVDGTAAVASDRHPGSEGQPFKTISRAAEAARPGDVVWVHPGTYREWVKPTRSGRKNAPIIYRAVKRGQVFIKGSDCFTDWEQDGKTIRIQLDKGTPFDTPLSAAESRVLDRSAEAACLGQVFVNGKPYAERGRPWTDIYHYKELRGKQVVDPEYEPVNEPGGFPGFGKEPGTWTYDNAQKTVSIRLARADFQCLETMVVELAVRSCAFSPAADMAISNIQVHDFVMEQCANQFPLEFWNNWRTRQTGVLGTGEGGGWVIEGNVIRYGKSIGIQAGGKGGHLIRGNEVCHNGSCGIAGSPSARVVVEGNLIHHNNHLEFTAHENGGIKFHQFHNGRIAGNVVWRNLGHGIWIDNGWENARVTGNYCIGNAIAGIFCEIDYGPARIDRNVVWGSTGMRGQKTPMGYGIYLGEARHVVVEENLVGGNAGAAVFGRALKKRTKKNPATRVTEVVGLQNNVVCKNIFSGKPTIELPRESEFAGDNKVSGNREIGACTTSFEEGAFVLRGATSLRKELPLAGWLIKRLRLAYESKRGGK